jgi:PAS domain-containing protein
MIRARFVREQGLDGAELDAATQARLDLLISQAKEGETVIEDMPNGRLVEARRRFTPEGFLLLIFTDVTERERQMAALQQSEAKAEERSKQLQAILEHVPHGVAYLDKAGDLVLANDDFYSLFDFPHEMGPGTPGADFTRLILERTTGQTGVALQNAAAQRLQRIYDECQDGGVSWDQEHRDDGRSIEIRRRLTPDGA